jgi:hypothetical protein
VVAVDQGPEVQHHQVTRRDPPRRRAVVGPGAVGAGRHDGLEAHVVGTHASHGGVQLEPELGFGGPVGQAVAHLGEGGVGDGGRRFDAGDLSGVLHPPEVLHQGGGGDEPTAHRGRQLGVVALRGPGDRRRLEPDPEPGGAAPEPAGERVGLALGPAHLEVSRHPGCGQLGLGLLAVPGVGEEHEPIGGDQHPPGRAREPGEVADVREVGDEEDVDPGLGEPVLQPGPTASDLHGGQGSVHPQILAGEARRSTLVDRHEMSRVATASMARW